MSRGALPRRRGLARIVVALLSPALAATAAYAAPSWAELKARLRRRHPTVPQLTVLELQAWLQDANRAAPMLLDVRSAAEFADGHLAGAVRAETLPTALRALRALPPQTEVVIYCSVGVRSSALAEALIAHGVQRVRNLEGSLFEWANAGLPVAAEGDRPGGKVHPYDRDWGTLLRRDAWSREP